ncbi:MAG: riboflavin synthase [Saprospirales bacterium]|nr:MAG: riboflavin synthase [Saprospirales bacterium]
MFTGIIKETGMISSIVEAGSSLQLWVRSPLSTKLKIDQSVSHDGICLTVDDLSEDAHRLTVVKETIDRTNIKHRVPGDLLNLETSATPTTLLDGHIVQGHVDDTAKVISIENLDGSWYFWFSLPASGQLLVVNKGSIAINGVSLTIAKLMADQFSVAIIPYTFENTGFNRLKVNEKVNLEYDVIGKYVARMIGERKLIAGM